MYSSATFLILLLATMNTLSEARFSMDYLAREHIRMELFFDYNPASRPAPMNITIMLDVKMELQHFDFRESDGAMHLIGLLDVSWIDPKLHWNPKDYNNITHISVNQNIVWVPDLEMYNNAPDKFFQMHSNGLVELDYTGRVFWSDTVDLITFCSTNMKNWPHDRHHCSINLGSWTYDGNKVDISKDNLMNSISFNEVDVVNMEYKIVSFSAQHNVVIYQCCAEPYVKVDYEFVFERKSSYVVLFRIPAFCIILLTLLALTIEPQRTEKLWLNSISFLLITFHLIYFANSAGKFSRGTPYIVSFYSCSLVLVTLCQIISVFSLFASKTLFRGSLLPFVDRLIQYPILSYLVPSADVPPAKSEFEDSTSHFEEVKLQEYTNLIPSRASPYKWIQLAVLIERLSLIIFSLIFLILGSICFV